MNLPSYQFSTHHHVRPEGAVRYPLYFHSVSNGFGLSEAYWIDYSIELERLELEDSAPQLLFRRYQSHFYPSTTNIPRLYAAIAGNTLSVQFVWYMTTVAFQQIDAPAYTEEDEQEILQMGTWRGLGIFERWQDSDTLFFTELLNLKFHQVVYSGEPTQRELELLLERQREIATLQPINTERDRFGRPIASTPARSSLTQVDVRPYRPINIETILKVPDDVVLAASSETKTLDTLIRETLLESQNPEIGVLKSTATQSEERTEFPQPSDLQEGINLFNQTLAQINQEPTQCLFPPLD
ncbi:hypothetical protein ACQ4M3_19130 [Leptolyngbya sp. AN03gr2]|uniref:hypothetical protein n=1 Tax=Leptolyngbya sp. AN03gr2 TaxID=3423364 RepID=UPI003D3239F0